MCCLQYFKRVPYLAWIGFAAIEIHAVARFPALCDWGDHGVFPYAPHSTYCSANDLRALMDAAHGHGLMAFLDVVYDHFGPLGNPLPRYASAFFRQDDPTPTGLVLSCRILLWPSR
jgi:maltooligosyltrehalose trehalohydrolase